MTLTRGKRFLAAVAAGLLFCTAAQGAEEQPPEQNTRLHFQKRLFVHSTNEWKIFAENKVIEKGDTLWKIMVEEYGVSEEALPTLIEAFRDMNPGVRPEMIYAGSELKIPFKVEQKLSTRGGSLPPKGKSHRVEAGESLWKILKKDYGMSDDEIKASLAAVAEANPRVRDLNKIYVGQLLVIPFERKDEQGEEDGETEGLPNNFLSVLEVLSELRCSLMTEGETFIPLERGRTVRLDAADFPVVTGPSGKKLILDPDKRLSASLAQSIEKIWGYPVIMGVEGSPGEYLGKILIKLDFHELSHGSRSISLGQGVRMVADVRWSVIPTPEDLWEGKVHLFFPEGKAVDPLLADTAGKAGFAVHLMGAAPRAASAGGEKPDSLNIIRMDDPAEGLGELMRILGVDNNVRPELEVDLGGGVVYEITPEITFSHGGLKYAVAPAEPANAESILLKAGYFTVAWPRDAAATNKVADLLSLLGTAHRKVALELPEGEPLRVKAEGLSISDEAIVARVQGGDGSAAASAGELFITEADITQALAALLADNGYQALVLKK